MREEMWSSRPLAAAERLGELAEDRHRFLDKQVLLTGEAEVLGTPNGKTCFDAALRLLPRLCPNVTVWVPTGVDHVRDEAEEVARQVAFGRAIEFVHAPPSPDRFAAILNVGQRSRGDLPWTAVTSNGWLARVSSSGKDLLGACDQVNPIGALFATSLGVTDVFKRLIRLKPTRGGLFDALTFSLYSYEAGSTDPGPQLPLSLAADTLLVGAGAIGNAIAYLIGSLPVTGRMWVVDPEAFGDENLGTCILIGPGEVGAPKARFLATWLESRLEAQGYPEKVSTFKLRLGRDIPYPSLILSAVDKIDARHEIQDIWPDLILDGATGDFPCQVSRHPWGVDVACMRCLFRNPAGASVETVASHATGLGLDRVVKPFDLVSEEDVASAPEGKRAFLLSRVGKEVCAVVAEAVAKQLSEGEQRAGFEPSVPFVACLSACMVVAEMVKTRAGWDTVLDGRFQFDSLVGPARGLHFPQRRRTDCLCTERRANIEQVRRRRPQRG
jgi:molybdopterin/thiamine biosynthesis adenylyltransferase